ncbi:MAG: hypothetical protein KDC87_05230 [Planctomycetes bacterium]|nr:hypothetical protein [Planctomycetota bacterium]MCB9889247.1 hypothetical protein [Planctomycetota bacterium]
MRAASSSDHPAPVARALILGLLAGCAGITATRAQVKPPPAQTPRPEGQRWVILDKYDTRISRAAFAACDGDGDDRLSVVEARYSLRGMEQIGPVSGFAALDTDRDGYLCWPDFDARYRQRIELGTNFQFRPVRPFTKPRPSPTKGAKVSARSAVDLVMNMVRLDDDPHMSRAEFAKLLEVLNQPPSAAGLFTVLDRDRSGGLTREELEPVVKHIPYLLELTRQADTSADAPSVDAVGKRLARFHPTVARWCTTILTVADKNRDGKLQLGELGAGDTKLPGVPTERAQPDKAKAP